MLPYVSLEYASHQPQHVVVQNHERSALSGRQSHDSDPCGILTFQTSILSLEDCSVVHGGQQ